MKKIKSKKITKKIVSFFIAFIIAFLPLFGCAFSVSAADNDPANQNYYSVVGSFDIVGTYHVIVPQSSTSSYEYVISSDNSVMRSYYGDVSMHINAGTNNVPDSYAPTTSVYAYRLLYPESYTPVSIMQIYLKANIPLEVGNKYRVTFDVTPAPGFAGWNRVYNSSARDYTAVPEMHYTLGTAFYTSFDASTPHFLTFARSFTSADDGYFGDTRYRFSYFFNMDANLESAMPLFLIISVPYFSGLSNTSLTTYVYTPIIEKVHTYDEYLYQNGFNNPNYTTDMNFEEDRLFDFVSSNQDQSWFSQSNIISTLGTGFLTGFRGSSHLVERFYNNVPFIRSLIYFSVSLGLAGFILNLGTSILGHFTHSNKKR